MKRLMFAVLALCYPLAAQTINPSQIRPSATNGQVVTTVDGKTQWSDSALPPGAVTAVTATLPIVSSGGTAPVISLTTVPITLGGTGATTAAGAANNLGVIINASNYGVLCDGSADVEIALQSALTYARSVGGGIVQLPPGNGDCKFSGGLVISPNTKLDAGSHRMLRNNADASYTLPSLINYSAVNPVRTLTDVTSTVNSTTIGSAAGFVSADVGRSITCGGIGYQSTYIQPLTARIVSQSGTTAVLDTSAGKTSSGVSCKIFNVDTNIEIEGGNWDLASIPVCSSGYLCQHNIVLQSCDHCSIHDATFSSAFAHGYAMLWSDTQYGDVQNITSNQQKDLVHFAGPGSYGYVNNLKGAAGDDVVALIGMSQGGVYDANQNTSGSFAHMKVSNLTMTSNVNSHSNLVDMLWGTFSDIQISKLSSYKTPGTYCQADGVSTMDNTGYPPTTLTGIVVDTLSGCFLNNPISLGASQANDLTLMNLHKGTGAGSGQAEILVESCITGGTICSDAATAHINNLSVDGWTKDADGVLFGGLLQVDAAATVETFSMSNIAPQFDAAGSSPIIYNGDYLVHGSINRIIGENIAPYYGAEEAAANIVDNGSSSFVLPVIELSNITPSYASSATGPTGQGALVHGPFTLLKVANSHFNFHDTGTSTVVDNYGAPTNQTVQISNTSITNGLAFFTLLGAQPFTSQVSGFSSIGTPRFVRSEDTSTVDFSLDGFTGDFSAAPFYIIPGTTPSAINVRCGSYKSGFVSDSNIEQASGTVANVYCPNFPEDTTTLASTTGEMAYNTNSQSGYVPLGPSIYNGSSWMPLGFSVPAFHGNTGNVDTRRNAFTNASINLSHTATTTINVSNLVNGAHFYLELAQDSTGGNTITLGTGCQWNELSAAGYVLGQTTPTLTAPASNTNTLEAVYDGTNCWYNIGVPGVTLYNVSGTQQTLAHTVIGSGNFATANPQTITFSGSAVFANSYSCTANESGSGLYPAINVNNLSLSQVVFQASGSTETYYFICIGN